MPRQTGGAAQAQLGGGASPRENSAGRSLGLKANSTVDLIHAIEQGLPFRCLNQLSEDIGIDSNLLASAAGIPARVLARRKVARRFDPWESERLVRLAMIVEQALRLFEDDRDAASRWLLTPRDGFEGHTPLYYCHTELGSREVETLIGRLEHGVLS